MLIVKNWRIQFFNVGIKQIEKKKKDKIETNSLINLLAVLILI